MKPHKRKPGRCRRCKGSGVIVTNVYDSTAQDFAVVADACPRCQGSGLVALKTVREVKRDEGQTGRKRGSGHPA